MSRFIHFQKFSDFNNKKLSANVNDTAYTTGVNGTVTNGTPQIPYASIVFIKDTKQVWTHGQLYAGETETNDVPLFRGSGDDSVEMASSEANGAYSVALGAGTIASNYASYAEGASCEASGKYSHAEGANTYAEADFSHAEGHGSVASGLGAHAEGGYYYTDEDNNFVDISGGRASGTSSHAEGANTVASGYGSHAEGVSAVASEYASHAEGTATRAYGNTSHAEGNNTETNEEASHAEGYYSKAMKMASHAEGHFTVANGKYSHTEGDNTSTMYINDNDFERAGHAEGVNTTAIGCGAHSEGVGDYKLSEQYYDDPAGQNFTSNPTLVAKGMGAHAEGYNTIAFGNGAHSEGIRTLSINNASHAEGCDTKAYGEYSHAEGMGNTAFGFQSHAEGAYNYAGGVCCHVEGYANSTQGLDANGMSFDGAHVEGRFNQYQNNVIHSVGVGTSDSIRYNAHDITLDGKHYIFGIGGYDGKDYTKASDVSTVVNNLQYKVATMAEIDAILDFMNNGDSDDSTSSMDSMI